MERCSSCGGEVVFDPDVGYVCSKCGLVVDDRPMVPDVPAGKSVDEFNSRARFSAFLTLRMHDYGIGTRIGGASEALSVRHVYRHRGIIVDEDRDMIAVLGRIHEFGRELGFPGSVVETACLIARKYLSQRSHSWKNMKTYVPVVSLYIASKMHNHPAVLDEIVSRLGVEVSSRILWRVYQDMVFALDLKLNTQVQVEGYVSRIAKSLNVSPETLALAFRILRNLDETGGKRPASIAAGVIYVASVISGDRVSLTEFRRVGVTEAGVRNGFRHVLSRVSVEVLL